MLGGAGLVSPLCPGRGILARLGMITTITLNPSIDRTLEIDRLVVGGLNRVKSKIDHPSGKGINVSRALSNLGQPTKALALVGGDNGKWLVDTLGAEGIVLDYVQVQGDTRTNLKIWAMAEGRETEINEPGPTVTQDELGKLQSRVLEGAAQWDWVVISGSMPPGTPPDFYAALVESAKSQGAKVVLDASGAALREGLKACPDLIKPNKVEVTELLGWEPQDRAGAMIAVRELVERGISYVLLTLGKDGAFVGHGDRVWQATPPEVPVKTTVGCGDSTVAGMLHGLMQGAGIEEAIRWAMATGAAAATTWGTEPPKLEAVRELLPLVEIRRRQ